MTNSNFMEPELDGMPERDVSQRIEFSFSREEFVPSGERLDVGSVLADVPLRNFEVRRVTHTVKDGIDRYVLVATEIV